MFRTHKFFMRGSRWCPLACVLVGSTATLLRAQEVEELSQEAAAAPQIVATQPATVENPQRQLASLTTSSFLRVESSSAGELKSLQTSVTRYRTAAPGGVQVDLIGAVHIGEPEYYAELNTLFDTYDVLLYELVAPEGTVIPKGGKREGTNPIALLQDTAKNMLGLASQLEEIDYTKAHFVRADMTPEQIAAKMSERGETALTLALGTLADVMRQQKVAAKRAAQDGTAAAAMAELEDLSLFDMMGNPAKMKRVLAQQFAATGSLDQALGGPLNQLLVVDRNGEALKVLQKQIALGKKKIGIFYGAAHLPDFDKRLINDFGLQPAEGSDDPRWLTAWDLSSTEKPRLSEPASLLLNLLKALE